MNKNNPCIKATKQFQNGETRQALRSLVQCKKQTKKGIRENSAYADQAMYYRYQLVRALRLEAQIEFSLKKSSKSTKILQEALIVLSNCPQNGDTLNYIGETSYTLAMMSLFTSDVDDVIELLEQSVSAFEQGQNHENTINVKLRLIDLFLTQGNVSTALTYLTQIDKQKKKIKDKKLRTLYSAKIKLGMGKIAALNGESEQAEKYFGQSKKDYTKQKDVEGQALVLLELGDLFQISEMTKSEEYYLEALDLGKVAGSDRIKGTALTRLGILALKLGKFKIGQKRLLKGLEFRKLAGDMTGTADTLIELSRITILTSRSEKDLSKAENFAAQALHMYTEADYSVGQATAHELLGTLMTQQNKLDTAHDHLREGRKGFKRLNDKNGEARLLTQLSIVLEKQGKVIETGPILSKAEKLYSTTSNSIGLAEVYQLQGTFTDNTSLAIDKLSKSRSIYEKIIDENPNVNAVLQILDKRIEALKEKN